MDSPYKKAADSPSRQLLWELGRLSVSQQERLHEQLEHNAGTQESLHRQALAAAAAEHARIRQDAEVEQQKLEARAELAREIKRQEDLREIERVRREKAEREASIRREAEEAEESARRVEEQRLREQEAKQQRQRQERERTEQLEAQNRADEEERKRKTAEAEAKAKEAAIAAQRKQAENKSAPQQKPTVSSFPTQPPAPSRPTAAAGQTNVNLGREHEQVEREHQRYLEIWKHLKELRNFVKDAGKSNPDLKTAMGDGRRKIRKCIGQLVSSDNNHKDNMQPNMEIRDVLRDSHRFTTPTVPMSSFIFAPAPDLPQQDIPALFLYLLNIFAKCLVSQFLGEVAIAPRTAKTIGITGATIFSQPECHWHGHSMVDVFLAKCHRVCPVLFGIWGDERTTRGKERLGWWWADESRTSFATEQRHYERMTGLGAGFASIALRTFKNKPPPVPAWQFWQAISRILGIPRDKITNTHLVVLKSLIEHNEDRAIELFGRAGRALLRSVLIDFPNSLPPPIRDGVHAQSLKLIPDVLPKEKMLYL